MEFIEEIEEIANAKPTTENELEKANKLIQEEKADRITITTRKAMGKARRHTRH